MADKVFKVGILNSVNKRINKMTPMRKKRYKAAINMLLTYNIEELERRERITKLKNDTYLYRVGISGRLLFAEREDMRVVLEAGTNDEILRRLNLKAAEHIQNKAEQ